MAPVDLEADLRIRIIVSAQRMRRSLERRARALGLTLSGIAALHVLLHARDEDVSPADLGRRLGVSRSMASLLADRLESEGYVEVVRDGWTPRFKSIHLTPDGYAAYSYVTTALAESGLTRDEALAAYPLLDRIELPTQGPKPKKRFTWTSNEKQRANGVHPPNISVQPKAVHSPNISAQPKAVQPPNISAQPKAVQPPDISAQPKAVQSSNRPLRHTMSSRSARP
jgi:DNA-binding MarR family transcriptional regulator